MSGGKSTTKSNQQSSSTVQLPEWMTNAGQATFEKAAGAIEKNPVRAYDGQMTAGMSGNQREAVDLARRSAGAGQSDLNTARAMTAASTAAPWQVTAERPVAATMTGAGQGWQGVTGALRDYQGVTGATEDARGFDAAGRGWNGYEAAMSGPAPTVTASRIGTATWDQTQADRYMNPWLQAVQGQTIRAMREQDSADRAGLNDQMAASGAFGGTRGALLESEQQKNQALARQDYVNSSSAQAYDTAFGNFTSDQGRVLQADMSNQQAELTASIETARLLDQLLGRNQSAENDARRFGAGAANDAEEANAGREQSSRAFYAEAQNSASRGNADREQASRVFSAGAANDAEEANAGREQSSRVFSANAQNEAMRSNADREQAARGANQTALNTIAVGNADRAFEAEKTNASSWNAMLDRLAAGGRTFGDIATASSNLTGADMERLLATGALEQGTTQAELDAQYRDYLRVQNGQTEQWKDLMAILSGAPRNVTTTGTSSGTSETKTSAGLLGNLMGGLQLAGAGMSLFSDPRLKRDRHLIERLADGLGVWRYRYLWDRRGTVRIGVMADEVARLRPAALGPRVFGFLTVNYAKLGGSF